MECVFCKIINGEIPCEKVLETDNFIVIKDVNPKVFGHSIVIPKKHFENLLDIPSVMFGEYLETVQRASFMLIEETKATGFNLIMNNRKSAGQIVPHAHIHILPRKEGDNYRIGV